MVLVTIFFLNFWLLYVVMYGENVPALAQSLSVPYSVIDDIKTATQSCQDPTGTSSWSLWKQTQL
jgi:hypothetical protein